MKTLLNALLVIGALVPSTNALAKEATYVEKLHAQSLWVKVPGSISWTAATYGEIRNLRTQIESARDLSEFCPGYESMNQFGKDVCLVRLVGAIAKMESSFQARDMYTDAAGSSVGLMALGEHECDLAPTKKQLVVPELNLICGVRIMSSLIARDGYISGADGARGASNYWVALSLSYKLGNHEVGKKDKVINLISGN